MKKLVLISVLAVSAVASFAQEKGAPKKPADKTEFHCSVMSKDKVDVEKATKDGLFADYKGRRYFFCCAGCPATFKKDPEKYAKLNAKNSIPTPSAKKANKKG